jgi:amidase
MGGSLRYPAQCCGIAAIKPSLGRLSRTTTTIFPEPPLFYEQVASVNGPMARHVKDLRLALDVMSSPDPSDPLWTPAPRLGATMPGPVRVALTTDPVGDGGSPAVAEGVRKAAQVLADAGYVIEEVDPPSIEEAGHTLEQIVNLELESYLSTMLPMISKEAQTVLKAILAGGETMPGLPAYMKAIGQRYRIAQDWSLFMEPYPLVLGPVSTLEPFEVGYDLSGVEELRRFFRSIRLTETCNLLGLPSLAVPVQVVDGVPQAVQLIGRRFHEDLCFDAAELIERQQGVFTPIEPRDAPRKS